MLDYNTIVTEVSQLSLDDRLRLMDWLAASVPDDQPPLLSEEWHAEIERRCQEIDSDAVTIEPWESIRERVFRKHGVPSAD